VQVTINQVINAVDKLPIPKYVGMANGGFFWEQWCSEHGQREIFEACALGAAAIHLGVDAEDLYEKLNFHDTYDNQRSLQRLGDTIAKLNDHTTLNLEEIANRLRVLVSQAFGETQISVRFSPHNPIHI
jgi:hypothetical protein